VVNVTSSIRRPSGRTSKRWLITFAATAVSTYALDAVATAGGLLLIWSRSLDGVDSRFLIAFLAASYVLWGAGLRVNLKANWALLEATGTSTNALSKAAYDLVTSRTKRLRARRIAAGIGYVSTELGKELPYYAGAIGAPSPATRSPLTTRSSSWVERTSARPYTSLDSAGSLGSSCG